MYLTRMELDVSKKETRKALASPSLLHGAIEASYAGERVRTLWRIDTINGHKYLLLLSPFKPDLSSAVLQFGVDNQQWIIKEYDNYINRIVDGSKWHFRLVANPTVAKISEKQPDERGKRCAHITTAYQKKWLMDRCEKLGFYLDDNSFDVKKTEWFDFFKGNKCHVRMLAVTYEGLMEVRDENSFKEVLKTGIGREKAYGMGMITVIPYEGK